MERRVRRSYKSAVEYGGATPELLVKQLVLSSGEAVGRTRVAVECVDIMRNNSGEGGLLDGN